MGLALATSLSAFLNAGLLFSGLLRSGRLSPGTGWLAFFLRLIFANAVMLGLLVLVTPSADVWFSFLLWERFAVMLLICAAGAVTYAASLVLAGYDYREALR